jgi:uncharacterized protein YegP (UPF0339 family)
LEEAAMAAKFVVHKDRGGKWRWTLKSSNGQTIATSGESFASRGNAEKAAHNVKERAGSASVTVED